MALFMDPYFSGISDAWLFCSLINADIKGTSTHKVLILKLCSSGEEKSPHVLLELLVVSCCMIEII